MSSTMESKSDKHTRVSTLNVRPSVAGIIADSDGNLDEKKAVAALSQTREQNKHMWIGCFVLIGVVLILIAANIGTSVAVARLTRQLNVDPVTGMATIPGSEDVVMKTSKAIYKNTNINFHSMSTGSLSTYETIEFKNGDLSFDIKGYARMSDETILLLEGGSLIFDINGLKNVTGDELPRFFSSVVVDGNSSDLDGRKLYGEDDDGWYLTQYDADNDIPAHTKVAGTTSAPQSCQFPLGVSGRCGPSHSGTSCPQSLQFCNEDNGRCYRTQTSSAYNFCSQSSF